jgi:hypothetical protein
VVAADRRVTWRAVPDPSGLVRGPLRFQLPEATRFRRGEGMWFDAGIVTPDRVVSQFVTADGRPGRQHEGSEFCGPVFSTDGSRLYVTSQRGFGLGAIMEITGPFRTRRPGGGDFGTPGASGPPTRDGRTALPAPLIGFETRPHPSEHAARGRPAAAGHPRRARRAGAGDVRELRAGAGPGQPGRSPVHAHPRVAHGAPGARAQRRAPAADQRRARRRCAAAGRTCA